MKSSPIYNIIDIPGRASNRSFGADSSFTQDIRVGTSASNSHTLANIEVKRHAREDGSVWFALFVDGIYLKGGLVTSKQYENYGSETMPS